MPSFSPSPEWYEPADLLDDDEDLADHQPELLIGNWWSATSMLDDDDE